MSRTDLFYWVAAQLRLDLLQVVPGRVVVDVRVEQSRAKFELAGPHDIVGLEHPEAVGPGMVVLRVVPQRGRGCNASSSAAAFTPIFSTNARRDL